MKISELVHKLDEIQAQFGNLQIVGGYLSANSGLTGICVVDTEGLEIFPNDPNGDKGKNKVKGIFLN